MSRSRRAAPRRATPAGHIPLSRNDVNRPEADRSGLLAIDPPAMRLSEVARRLAISRAAAYRLVTSGQLSAIRIGTSWRVLRVDLDAYLDRMRADAERRYRRERG